MASTSPDALLKISKEGMDSKAQHQYIYRVVTYRYSKGLGNRNIVGDGKQDHEMEIGRKTILSAARTIPKGVEGVSNWDDSIVRKILSTLLIQRPGAQFGEIRVWKSKLPSPFNRSTIIDRNYKKGK